MTRAPVAGACLLVACSAQSLADPDTTPRDTLPTFQIAARADTAIQVHALNDTLLVTTNRTLNELRDGKLVVDAELTRGLPPFFQSVALAGTWPSDVYADLVGAVTRSGLGNAWHRDAAGWRIIEPSDRAWRYEAFSNWSQGRVLALVLDSSATDVRGRVARLDVVHGALEPGLQLAGGDDPACGLALRPIGLHALPSGEVFVPGVACPSGHVAVDWYDTGGARRRSEAGATRAEVALAGHSERSAWIAVSAAGQASLLWRFDRAARSVTRLPPPSDDRVTALSVGPDDVLWLITTRDATRRLWRRNSAGDWRDLQVRGASGEVHPELVEARADGVWLSVGSELYTSAPRAGAPATLQLRDGPPS